MARSLYTSPVDILLYGPLGAGKTSFLQGLADGLGIDEPVSSPTYALEQRYATAAGTPFLHLDLYRLDTAGARELVHATAGHEGIRCIEWADRLDRPSYGDDAVTVSLEERGDGRAARIGFEDIPLPEEGTIEAWMEDVLLPGHVRDHCHAVAALCARLGAYLIARGTVVRATALHRAALVHDLLRFLDFRPGAAPDGHVEDPAAVARWEDVRARYPGMQHEEACAVFLRDKGYAALADIVAVHGLRLPSPDRATIEQQILFYADKRVAGDNVVSLAERFDDFARRYGGGAESERSRIWREEAERAEKALFPEGPPA